MYRHIEIMLLQLILQNIVRGLLEESDLANLSHRPDFVIHAFQNILLS